MDAPDHFIPNRDPRQFYPLYDFLRPISASVAEKYILALTAPGDLVIDPFGAMPTLAHVALKLGRRAIVIESNPLWAWLVRMMASLPPASEIDAALSQLGDTPKDDSTLRTHINQLYTTTCAACHAPTPADFFVHSRDAGIIARHYTCTRCGETRHDPASDEDVQLAERISTRGMHYHYALDRVTPQDDLHSDRIRKILDLYTPRNLYALVTLTQKIESRFHATRERSILLLLLLHLLDRGTSLYAATSMLAKPKAGSMAFSQADVPAQGATAQLTQHKQFVEFNLWREIELAVRALSHSNPALELAESARLVAASAEKGAFVGRANAITLKRDIPKQAAALIFTTPPPRRILVWALSYFWGAWILGRAAARPLAPFLDSQKDFNWESRWYSDALAESFSALSELLRANSHIVFAFEESWHQVIEALFLAAAKAGWELESFLFQPHIGEFARREFDDVRGEYRISFIAPSPLSPAADAARQAGPSHPQLEKQIRATSLAAASDLLARRGEALAFSWVHHAALGRLARERLLAQVVTANPKPTPGRFLHSALIAGLSDGYAGDFDHFESKEQFCWLRRSSALDPPLALRVDDAIHLILSEGKSVSREELEDKIYRQFPDNLTPEAGLIELCAAACADERDGKWLWRAESTSNAKLAALDVLARLGERLEFQIAQGPAPFDLTWNLGGEIAHGFIWSDRARIGELGQIHVAPAHGYLLIPETSVALLAEITHRMPHITDAFHEAGWHFVRPPFAEKLLNEEKLERGDIPLMTGLAPPGAQDRTQLELF
jgi:hypothetical protein